MNREQRLSIWTDETAHPGSPTTRAAMEASNASMQLVDEWADLEGYADNMHPMCYLDFLKGAIGLAADRDPKTEFESPDLQINRLMYQVHLWTELEKAVGELPHNELGENRDEYDRFITQQRNREEAAAEAAKLNEKTQAMLVRRPPGIVSIPGKFYARLDVDTNTILGFGFMPHGSDAGYFGDACVLEDGRGWNGPERFWEAVCTYLDNTNRIGGEAAMHVVWEEDGWTV